MDFSALNRIMSPASQARISAFSAWRKPSRAPTPRPSIHQLRKKPTAREAAMKRRKPTFGEVGTLTKEQSTILKEMMGAQAPTYAPVTGGAEAGGWAGPRPEYAPMGLAGAGERQAAMS